MHHTAIDVEDSLIDVSGLSLHDLDEIEYAHLADIIRKQLREVDDESIAGFQSRA